MYLCRCNLHGMDGVRLHRLGKRLINLAREVTTHEGDPSLTPAEVAVLEDALKHPGSPVSEIQARTGFAQSHVSVSVARLKERGLIETAPDPADRRRTTVRLAARTRRAILAQAGRSADETLARAVGDPATAERVRVLLDELAGLLL
jgi:DNA-binding MarR family transcriptional regulator